MKLSRPSLSCRPLVWHSPMAARVNLISQITINNDGFFPSWGKEKPPAKASPLNARKNWRESERFRLMRISWWFWSWNGAQVCQDTKRGENRTCECFCPNVTLEKWTKHNESDERCEIVHLAYSIEYVNNRNYKWMEIWHQTNLTETI